MCSSLRSQSVTVGFLGVFLEVRLRTWLYPDPEALLSFKFDFETYRIQKDLMAGAQPTAIATNASIVLEPKLVEPGIEMGEDVLIIQKEDWRDQLSTIAGQCQVLVVEGDNRSRNTSGRDD